jgi:hypothetical protein
MTTLQTLLTGGGLTAIGVVLAALAANWLGEKRDQRRYQHERDMARDARRQERLEQAYLELLRYLSHHLDWAKSVRPIWGPIPTPDPLPPEERWRIEALVTAYGSQEVLRLLHEWGERAAKVDNADATIRLRDQSRDPGEQFDDDAMREHRAIPEYKQAMFEADKAIRDRVQQELSGEA